MMVFDPPNLWWIRVGSNDNRTVKLSEATHDEIEAELSVVRLRANGYTLQGGITPQQFRYVMEHRLRLFDELFALQAEIADRWVRRFRDGLKD